MLCLKKLGLALIISSIIPLFGKPSMAQNTSCLNSWTNPSTGLEECLDRQFKGSSRTSNESNDNDKERSNNSSDLPGYIKVAETRQGDKVYVKADSIRIYKKSRWHTVSFHMITKFGIPDEGAWKRFISYSANCDTNTLSMSSYFNYDSNNQIIDGKNFGMTTASRYQSTMRAPQEVVNPNTVGYAALEYVCSLDK